MGHADIDDAANKEMGSMANLSGSPVHKVGFPPRRNFARGFTDGLKETFFADDPLRPYKDQPRSKKLLLGLRFLFPVLEWGRDYDLSKFKGDIVAGLTIATLCIPQVYYLDLDIEFKRLGY